MILSLMIEVLSWSGAHDSVTSFFAVSQAKEQFRQRYGS